MKKRKKKLSNNKNNRLNVVLKDETIIDLNKENKEKTIYGVAVDIGTTTIAMYLIDLSEGKEVKIHSFENPQKKSNFLYS